jgi:hypothetical protein
MGRPRTRDRHLPERVYHEEGRYRFRPKKGAPIELGSDLMAAMRKYTQEVLPTIAPNTAAPRTVGQWGDAYMLEVVPGKAERTQRDNAKEWRKLKASFGDLLPSDITQQHMARYLAARGAITRGNREKALLSHMLTWITFKGGLAANPLLNMRREFTVAREVPRDRLVTDKERDIFMAQGGDKLVLYCELKELTRLRKGDLLTLELSNLKDEGIEIQPRKTRRRHPRTGKPIGRRRLIRWSPDLKAVVDRILEVKRAQERRYGKISPWLFATRRGTCYYNTATNDARTFRQTWDRCMEKAKAAALAEGWELEHFTEHDLRGRAGGSAKLLGNSESVFRAHYDRAPEIVEPLRRK